MHLKPAAIPNRLQTPPDPKSHRKTSKIDIFRKSGKSENAIVLLPLRWWAQSKRTRTYVGHLKSDHALVEACQMLQNPDKPICLISENRPNGPRPNISHFYVQRGLFRTLSYAEGTGTLGIQYAQGSDTISIPWAPGPKFS